MTNSEPDPLVTCIRCKKSIRYSYAMIDDKGQFPDLSMKATNSGDEETILCFDCYETLTETTDDMFDDIDPVRKYL